MTKDQFTDKEIKEAVIHTVKNEVNLASNTKSEKPVFTDDFYGLIHNESMRQARKIKTEQRLQRVAMFIFAFLLTGSLFLGFNTTAHEKTADWIKEITGKRVVYTFDHDQVSNAPETVPDADLSFLGDSYSITCAKWEDNYKGYIAFLNGSEQYIELTYQTIKNKSSIAFVFSGKSTCEKVMVGDIVADLYTPKYGGDYLQLIWFDEKGIVFSLEGPLSQQKIIELAKKIQSNLSTF